ncbi:hypothetical protein H8E65_02870 [Candidatus Bathyarchaeota archaeon]|nr:hypothetical protein [Candidatus Bathyarchaeota archaeon]MBL7080755.1 hypothetical protein [Candidatus Bathyarchaeota archaeon]
MTKRQYMAVIAGPIAVIAIIVSILNTGLLETPDDRIENIKIEVTYSGSWEGVLYNNEEMQRISGFTRKTIIVFRPNDEEWTLSFEAEKKDDSSSQLKAVVKLIDGTRLGESQTVDPYGKISLTLAIG